MTAQHYAGTPLTGATAKAIANFTPQDCWSAKVTFVALEKMPAAALEPLSNRARLLWATRSGVPVIPSGRLVEGVKFVALNDAESFLADVSKENYGRNTTITTVRGALPTGVTASFVAADNESLNHPSFGQPQLRSVAIEISRPGRATTNPTTTPAEQMQLALSIDDMVAARASSEMTEESGPTTAPSKPVSVFQTESALVDQIPIANQQQCAIFIPFRFDSAESQALLAVIEVVVNPTDAAEHAQAVSNCTADLQRSAEQAGKRPHVALIGSSEWTTIASALDSLAGNVRRRPALVFLCNQTGASLAEDLAMVIDDQALAQLSDSVVAKARAAQAPLRKIDVGWMLDKSCLELLNEQLSGNTLPPELSAVLTLYAGEAGRHPASMEEIVRGVTGPADLENRVIAENYIYLEDSSPAARVRAFDWLNARNRAPADYDPLAPLKQRRDALEKALANPAAQTPSPTTSVSTP